MALFRRLFSRKSEEDYDAILANLVADIQRREVHLSEIRQRQRRVSLLLTAYTTTALIAYVLLWYFDILPHFQHGVYVLWGLSAEAATKSVPLFVGPVLILFSRRIVHVWYTSKGNAEEKAIKELRKTRHDKIEEMKKKTNFNHTRDLIQKYDDPPSAINGTPAGTPVRQRFNGPGPAGMGMQTPVQRRPMPGNPNGAGPNGNGSVSVGRPGAQMQMQTPGRPGASAALQSHLTATPPTPLPPPKRGILDRMADALLGEDELPAPALASTRFALICERCYAHNGLVKESMWEDAQYACPKCGHFNESARAKAARERALAEGRASASAASSPTAIRLTRSHDPAQMQMQSRLSTSPPPASAPASGSASAVARSRDSVSVSPVEPQPQGDQPTVDGAHSASDGEAEADGEGEGTAMEVDSSP